MSILSGGSKGGRTGNPGFRPMASQGTAKNAYVQIDPDDTEPSAPDQVAQRDNAAIQGVMLKDQLLKNKSGSSPV